MCFVYRWVTCPGAGFKEGDLARQTRASSEDTGAPGGARGTAAAGDKNSPLSAQIYVILRRVHMSAGRKKGRRAGQPVLRASSSRVDLVI